MRITRRVATKQGHPIPSNSHSPRGPFPAEIFSEPEIITDYQSFDDDIPVGATAQNNFRSPRLFRCNNCSMVVFEHEMPNHWCDDVEDEEVDGEDT